MHKNNSQLEDEKMKFTDVLPTFGLLTILFFIIHSFHSSNLDELTRLRDQSWKIINIDITPPYHYQIRKMKYQYFIDLFDGNSEIYSTDCGYKMIKMCKDEFPEPSGKIKKFEFYKSSNSGKNNLAETLRIKSIQYLDENNQLQSIALKAEFPNTNKAVSKQKWKLGFSTFISVWFFLFLVYLTSIFTLVPLFVKQLLYIVLIGNMVYIILKSLMILI